MLLPIIMILVCVLLGGSTLLFLKFSERRKKAKSRDKEELAQMTANEFVNVKDIRGSFLYTRDGMALAYLKIFPISTELFSKNEKRRVGECEATIDWLLTDSRSLSFPEETLFFALTTKRNSGARYIPDLYDRGVRNFVVTEEDFEKFKNGELGKLSTLKRKTYVAGGCRFLVR